MNKINLLNGIEIYNEFTQYREAFVSYESIEQEDRKINKLAKEYITSINNGVGSNG